MKKSLVLLGMLCAGVTLSSCASVKIKAPEAMEIKKVAFVGFEIFRRSDGSLFGLVTDASAALSEEEKMPLADMCYETFQHVLSKENNWLFVESEAITSNSEYSKYFKENGRSKTFILDAGKRYHVENIATGRAIRDMAPDLRNKIMDSLDVDALLVFEALAYPGKTSSIFNLSFVNYRTTVTSFAVYTRESEDPVIQMKNVVGKTAKDSHLSFELPFANLITNDSRGLVSAVEEAAIKISKILNK